MIESRNSTERHVYVILLNWNGWRDTIECLESVFRLGYPRLSVIVCDNASSDNSMEKIQGWARGRVAATCGNPDLARLVQPPVPKPIAFRSISASEEYSEDSSPDGRLILIQTGANLGFAGGNNVGIRHALRRDDCDYVWLLNNDTVVEPESLSAMVQMAEADPLLGICGSQLRNYSSPHNVQTMGGRWYERWSGRSRPLCDSSTPGISTIPGAPDYVEGASMLISRRCLQVVGLLEESYFLYYEELDLAVRARRYFHLGYSPASVVYHKEGSSIGSASVRSQRSALSDFYQARNRILFTRRHYAWFLPSVVAATGLSAVQRLLIGRPRNALSILRGAVASFK